MRSDHARSSGFTLIEILVSLAIFAIAFLSIETLYGETVASRTSIKQRIIAQWVVDNLVNEMYLNNVWPDLTSEQGTVEMAGHHWYWSRNTRQTSEKNIRLVIHEIRVNQGDESAIFTQETYHEQQ
jgi:general secretion pathway protein I